MEKLQNFMEKINLENKKVLIIGGAGFIGHNLALELKEKKSKSEHHRWSVS